MSYKIAPGLYLWVLEPQGSRHPSHPSEGEKCLWGTFALITAGYALGKNGLLPRGSTKSFNAFLSWATVLFQPLCSFYPGRLAAHSPASLSSSSSPTMFGLRRTS